MILRAPCMSDNIGTQPKRERERRRSCATAALAAWVSACMHTGRSKPLHLPGILRPPTAPRHPR
jgi:hypothetical protein